MANVRLKAKQLVLPHIIKIVRMSNQQAPWHPSYILAPKFAAKTSFRNKKELTSLVVISIGNV